MSEFKNEVDNIKNSVDNLQNLYLNKKSASSNLFTLIATGDGEKDTLNLIELVGKIDRGTIFLDDSESHFVFDGKVVKKHNKFSNQLSFGKSSIFICGMPHRTKCVFKNKFSFGFGTNVSFNTGLISMPKIIKGSGKIINDRMSEHLKEGDWVAFFANNEIPELLSHANHTNQDGLNFPGEMHRVQKIKGKEIVFNGRIEDDYIEKPVYKVIRLTGGCGISNLEIIAENEPGYVFVASFCENFKADNLLLKKAGQINLKSCVQSSINNCVIDEQWETKNSAHYGIVNSGS